MNTDKARLETKAERDRRHAQGYVTQYERRAYACLRKRQEDGGQLAPVQEEFVRKIGAILEKEG